jgi:catechol 2,3-dioxygenase-like lactoylglutathione lyase family enzyme
MQVTGVDHVQVAIPPGGERQARDFYGGALGLEEIPKPGALAVRGGIWYACGGQQLHLGIERDFRPARKAHPALLVDGLDLLVQRLIDSGYAVRPGEDLPGVRRCFVDDPFGNRIELLTRI